MNEHVFTATIDEEAGTISIRLNRNYSAKDIEALLRPQTNPTPKRKN
jgi:hypothetical protein